MTVIPDSIEPLVLWRSWNLRNGKLISPLYDVGAWVPDEATKATCSVAAYDWCFVRSHGLTFREAEEQTASLRDEQRNLMSIAPMISPSSYTHYPDPPRTIHPQGYGLALIPYPAHEAPDADCRCGIYGANEREDVPSYGHGGMIFGTVSIWGKIVPGESGARGEFAYPASFIVPPELENDENLLAFGVPITVEEQGFAQRLPTRWSPLNAIMLGFGLGAAAELAVQILVH